MRKLEVGDKFIDQGYRNGGIATITAIYVEEFSEIHRYRVTWGGLDNASGGRDVNDPDLREVTPLEELL